MDGWEFRAEQRNDPDLCETPVVVLTASTTPQAAAIHADRVLHKPLSLDSLVETLQAVVDERRRRAELESGDERMNTLATLADGVANRINVPISMILSALRSLQELQTHISAEPRVRERARQHILDGLGQTDAIRRVVHDLWTFSRVEDRMRSPVDVRAVVESCTTMVICRMRCQARFSSVHEDVPPVLANQARLVTLYSHILTNAAEAARSKIETRVYGKGRDVVVEISDDGSGMSATVLRRVFDPFFSTKPASEGSGLGLSIAHGIASSLGGRIEVESAIGHGATFRVLIPHSGSGCISVR
jgi:signal transduction histidine kinase